MHWWQQCQLDMAIPEQNNTAQTSFVCGRAKLAVRQVTEVNADSKLQTFQCIFILPNRLGRGLAAISPSCLWETELAFLVHWRRRGYAQTLDLFRIICILQMFLFFYEWIRDGFYDYLPWFSLRRSVCQEESFRIVCSFVSLSHVSGSVESWNALFSAESDSAPPLFSNDHANGH